MVEKETVGVRLPQDKVERIENLADEKNISKSDATRRLINKGIEFQESPINTLVTQVEDSETENDKDPVTDGGTTIIRDLLNFMAGLYASITLSLFIGISVLSITGIPLPYLNFILNILITTSLLTAVVTIPLYSDLPEKADQLLYSGVGRIPLLNKVVA